MIPVNKRELAGHRFGRLSVIGDDGTRDACGRVKWKCECDCGNIVYTIANVLDIGRVISCGCARSESKLTHGNAVVNHITKEYRIWHSIKDRCYRKTHKRYADYGGRGIKVCDRWRNSFENFLQDMGKCPDGMSIERIDNNGDYNPDNTRWATPHDQSRNMRTNVWVNVGGDIMVITDAIKHIGISWSTLYRRMKKYNLTHQQVIDYYI